jgi:hypothetical protein
LADALRSDGPTSAEPLTAAGIYQMAARRGQQCGVDVYPHRFRHHFSHTSSKAGLRET